MVAFGEQDVAEYQQRFAQLVASLQPPTFPTTYVAYTDGACFGNPSGPGGWGAYVFQQDEPATEWNLWGHLTSTSNNRAEALAILAAIEWLPPYATLEVWSDSELSVNILTGAYKAKKNAEIWALIRQAVAERHLTLRPQWLRGHVGHPGNERADHLSRLGARNHQGAFVPDAQVAVGAAATAASAARAAREKPLPAELEGVQASTPWERSFLASVGKQLKAGKALSEKQAAIVDRMRSRGSRPPA